jgi:hypothetical protein
MLATHPIDSAPITTSNYVACPTGIVEAPVGIVWMMLTDISGWGSFYNVRVISVEPPGPAIKGQRMLGEAGPRWLHLGVSFHYTLVDATNYKLELDARFPIGITVHEAIDCIPLDGERCRVNYHCNFGFPSGWRGRLTRILLSLRLKDGPADSLMRLKHGAENNCNGWKVAKNGS